MSFRPGAGDLDDPSPVELLLRRRRALQQELKRVTRRLETARAPERRAEGPSLRLTAETTTERQTRLILSAFYVANFDTENCLLLLERVVAAPPWNDLTVEEREGVVHDLFLRIDQEDLEAWVHSDDQENHSRMRELWVLWAECRTAQWVSRVNATRGVAPSSQAVYSVFLEWRQQAPADYLPRDLDRSLAWRRQWACRWRERWEASMGNLKTGDLDTREIMRQKARGGTSEKARRRGA